MNSAYTGTYILILLSPKRSFLIVKFEIEKLKVEKTRWKICFAVLKSKFSIFRKRLFSIRISNDMDLN